MPLVVSSPVWSPWGPGLVAPLAEDCFDNHGNEFGSEGQPLQQKRQRSHSWGGYASHAQLTSHGCESDSDSQSDLDKPRKAMSDRSVVARGRRRQRGRNLDECHGGVTRVEPALTPSANVPRGHESRPVLLGSRKAAIKPNDDPERLNAGPKPKQPMGITTSASAMVSAEKKAITTLAIRNLPYSLAQQDLLKAIEDSGFSGLYDFVYLPHKFKEHKNLGFAFINFVSEDAANKFTAEWQHTHRFTTRGMRKPLNISPAVVQGRQANEKNATSHKMDRVKNTSFRPMLLDGSAGGNNVY